MTVVEEPTSGGGSLPLVLRIVETSEEKFCEGWGWAVVGVEERGVLPLVEAGCPAVMEEPEVAMLDGSERLLLEAIVSSLSLLFFFFLGGVSCMRADVRVRVCACVCMCCVWGGRVDSMLGQGAFCSLLWGLESRGGNT